MPCSRLVSNRFDFRRKDTSFLVDSHFYAPFFVKNR